MSQRIALWLVPIAIGVHDLEEALFIRAFLPFVNRWLRTILGPAAPDLTARTYFTAFFVVTLIPFVIGVTGDLSRKRGLAVYAMVTIVVGMLLNVGVHLGGAVLARGYVPGLVTAVAVILPLSAYLLRRAVCERWVTRWALVTVAAVLLHGPGVITLLLVARRAG